MRVRFLGTSTSYGVPVIGCPCPTCTSTDPRNRRTRASVYVETDDGVRLLIDSGPEMRLQALREGITRIDAVLYTHFHADHTAGIDDLKAFNASLGGLLPCFGDALTGASLRERFAYAFAGTPWIGLIPHIGYTVVDSNPFYVGKTCVQPIPMRHGAIRSSASGWRWHSWSSTWGTGSANRRRSASGSRCLSCGLHVRLSRKRRRSRAWPMSFRKS